MALFASTLRALLPLFCLILAGYGLRRLRVLRPEHVPVMNGIVVNATLPALVIHSLATASSIPREMIIPALLIVASECVVVALAYALGRALRLGPRTAGALMLVAAFGNTGFLGYPIALALLPHQFTAAVLIDQLGMGPPLFLLAPLLGVRYAAAAAIPGEVERPAAGQSPKAGAAGIVRVLTSPIFAGLAIGLLARIVPVPHALAVDPTARALADVVDRTLVYLGQGTTPLVLLALGVALRPSAVGRARVVVALAVLLKLGVEPLAMWLLSRTCGLHGELLAIGVVQAAMPAAVMASVLSATNDLDGDSAVAAVFVTTVLSAFTIPFWATIVR